MAMSVTRPRSGTGLGAALPGQDQTQLFTTLNTAVQAANREALGARIPGLAGLEQSSSNAIASLLNPPAFYSDVDRRSAELAAGRGVSGSALGFGVGLKMTDEERLKRLALGQDMLTAATARNPVAEQPNVLDTIITPAQQADLDLRARELEMNNQLQRFKMAQSRGVGGSVNRGAAGTPIENNFIKTYLFGIPFATGR